MFWGLIMEPNRRYTQTVVKPFHVSQAAMDTATGDNDPCQVMVVVDGKNFLICTLQKNKTIQQSLDLYFGEGSSISFLTNGKCNVHLTGYVDPNDDHEMDEEEDEEEEEVPVKNKRKLENGVAEGPSKKAKKKKVSEESSDEEADEDQLQKFLAGEDLDSDDNDDSFKDSEAAEDSDEDVEDEDEEEEDEEGDEGDEDEEAVSSEAEANTSQESAADQTLSKSQKKRLKKKLAQANKGLVNGTDKPKNLQKEKLESNKQAATEEKKEKKTTASGLVMEDLKVGNGPVAKAGKMVQVYYEGRLKSNNKVFDSCTKGQGFKFHLGSKEVIKGWDAGVLGMKVGGKRKLVCPPAMAYGSKGSPPVIPPNATLVFEVELKSVK